jgi:hypothetical protein
MAFAILTVIIFFSREEVFVVNEHFSIEKSFDLKRVDTLQIGDQVVAILIGEEGGDLMISVETLGEVHRGENKIFFGEYKNFGTEVRSGSVKKWTGRQNIRFVKKSNIQKGTAIVVRISYPISNDGYGEIEKKEYFVVYEINL